MARYRRSHSRPTFKSHGHLRLMSMVLMLGVLWMMYQRAADPKTWAFLAELDGDEPVHQVAAATGGKLMAQVDARPDEETIIPTPGADDPEEQDALKEECLAIADRSPLDAVEMASYWRLMRWSRGLSFAELEQAARRDVLFTNLWEEPEKYRGQPIRLRLHVKRTLSHEAPQNPAGVKNVYEAWGWTEESRSFPYLVVFSDLPKEMPLGADIHEEAVFVGYFMKLMSYQAFDHQRAAPLLIGRLKWQANPARAALRNNGGGHFLPTAIGGGLLVIAIVGSWVWQSRRRKRSRLPAQNDVSGAEWWEQVRNSGGEIELPASGDENKTNSTGPRGQGLS